MPIVKVYGIPDAQADIAVDMLYPLREAVAGVEELGLSISQVSVFCPRDLVQDGLGEEIIAFVDGLFKNPQRTGGVRQKLAKAVRDVLRKYFPEAELVECFVKPYDQKLGYATSAETDE